MAWNLQNYESNVPYMLILSAMLLQEWAANECNLCVLGL